MKQTKTQKKEASKTLAETLKEAPYIYFTEYQGLKFQELASLRSKLKPLKCGYKVVKNSILDHALRQAGVSAADAKLFAGPNAVLIPKGDDRGIARGSAASAVLVAADPVGAAKVLAQFAKEFPALKIKAGYVDAKWMGPVDCEKLSKLGSRPQLLAQLAGVLYSTTSRSAAVLAAPIRDFVLVLQALEEKRKTAPAAA